MDRDFIHTEIEVNYTKKGEDKTAIVFIDTEDANWMVENDWRLDKDGYVVRGKRVDGVYKTLRLHREVMKRHKHLVEDGTKWVVDHKNNDKLDNRKSNLRVCKQGENNKNRRSKRGRLKGISKVRNGYKVTINAEGRAIYIGTFPNQKMAEYFYSQAVKQLHGSFANLPSDIANTIDEVR